MPLDANLAAPSAADIPGPDDASAISVPLAAEERSAGCLPPADMTRAAASQFSAALALLQGCVPL